MTTTVHEQGARWAMERFMKTPYGGPLLMDVLDGFRNGRWPDWYVETIGQDWQSNHPTAWPMEQVHAFFVVNDWIQRGAVAVVDIEVGAEPEHDHRRKDNQAAINGLGAPYIGTVDQDQHCGDGDGSLEWAEPIAVSWLVPPGEWNDKDTLDWAVGRIRAGGWAPLEIGSTKPSVTAFRLGESRALARWPYGHKTIRLFVCTETFAPLTRDVHGKARHFKPDRPLDQRKPLPLLAKKPADRPEDLTRTATTP